MFFKKGVLRIFVKLTGKHLCQSPFFNKVADLRPQACNFINKETLAQVFSFEFPKIFKNFCFYRSSLVAASAFTIQYSKQIQTMSLLYKKNAEEKTHVGKSCLKPLQINAMSSKLKHCIAKVKPELIILG